MRVCGTIVCCLAMAVSSLAATHSFDQSAGVLSVDYGRYLSKHNLVFNKPITDFHNALTVGNGRVGAMVWSNKGLTLQVSNVDASEQSCFSSGLVTLSTLPGMDTGYAVFQQYLSMYDGTMTIHYDNNRTITIFGSPVSEALGIHVEDGRPNVTSVTLTVSMWDPATQMTSTGGWNSMAANVPDINTWKTVSTFASATSAGLSRGQTDVNNFGYTLAATVEGAAFTTKQVDSRTVQIGITPSASYTVWIANTGRMNALNRNSVDAASTLLSTVKTAGYSATLASFTAWWHDFWKKSFVQYSNATGDADYCETFYYLATYLVASGAYGTYPFHFINGIYKSNNDIGVHWSGAYWYWNQRDVYNSFLASNHPDVMSGLYRLYTRVLPALKTLTMARFSIDGAWTPETMGFNGDATFTTTSTYTDRIMSTGAEVAHNMYLRSVYTRDSAFLRDTAYPYMRETVKFYCGKLSYDTAAKQYYMANSNAHETYWGVKNAITDLAAVRMLFPAAIAAGKALGQDASLRTQWQTVLDNLVPYKTETYNSQLRYLAYDPPPVQQSNGENITCELAWPYDISGLGRSDLQTAINSWNSRPNPYSNVWSPDAIQAARLGMGDNAFTGMKRMLASYQSYANGFTNNTNGVFEYIGVHPIAVNESLLHGYCDTIRVFPATPTDASFSGKFTLAAKGGFLVSGEKEGGEIKYAGILSKYGGQVILANPWPATQVQARACADNTIVATTSGDMVSFPTSAGGVYVVERTAKKLDSYTFASVTASPNGSAKTMTYNGTTCTLGSGQGAPVGVASGVSEQKFVATRIITTTTGARIHVPGASEATPYRVSVYTPAGKLLCVTRAQKPVVEISGFSNQIYIVRCEPLSR
jgi:alpha-L-fucosidase 2